MGCCSSAPRTRIAADGSIDDLIAETKEMELKTIRVLLLGTGDSGKSTMWKQMHRIYTEVTETETQKREFASPIRDAIIQWLRTLSLVSKEWAEARPECNVQCPELEELDQELCEKMSVLKLTPDCVEQLTALWEDEGIQRTFEHRNEFWMSENVAYFMGRMKEIAEPSYVPTFEDYIRFGMRTAGHCEKDFPLRIRNAVGGDFTLKVTDTGGQKAERKKWMNLFSPTDFHVAIYVVAANGYDSVVFEDSSQNQWRDSLQLFGELAERHMFDKLLVVILFNKKDLFSEKIRKVPVTVEFSEEFEADDTVTDPDDAIQVLQFVFHMFQKSFNDKVPLERRSAIQSHATVALDTDAVKTLLEDVLDDRVQYVLSMSSIV